MTSPIRSLARETLIYGVSTVLARSMGLLLLPVLTNLLPLEQYGHLRLTYALVAVLQLFFIFGMGTSLVRHLIGAEDKAGVFSTHFWPLLAVCTVFAALVWLSAERIAGQYFAEQVPGDAAMIRLAAVLLWLDGLATLPYSALRAENRPFFFLAGTLASVLVYAGLVVFLLAWRNLGMTGVLWANLAGSASALAIFVPVFRSYLRPRFDSKTFRVYFAFGFPIIFSSLGKILLDLADRWILDRLMGAAVVAYYSAGYQMGAVANLAVAAFNLAWKPFLVRVSAQPDAERVFSRVMTLSMTLLCGLFLAVSLFAEEVAGLRLFGFNLIARSYWPGLAVVPLVMVSYVLYGAYINLTVGCDLTRRTHYYALSTGVAALFNIGANFLLIPVWGMMGAAWATLAAYLVQAVLLYVLVRRVYTIRYDWGALGRLALITSSCFAAAKLLQAGPLTEAGILALFVVLLLVFRVLDYRAVAGALAFRPDNKTRE